MAIKVLHQQGRRIGDMPDRVTEDFMKSIKSFIAITLAAGFTLIGSGLLWVVHTTQQDSTDIAVVKALLTTMASEQVTSKTDLESQIREIKINASDRYTGNDATKDLSIRDKAIEHNSTEIEMIDKRLETLEMKLAERMQNGNYRQGK